ncbi:Replication protein A 32 kDa subunit [Anabarilius grahami]|uniref:Replication protein A 32 kDa subunit n=1 Tax=Anabarilius grahami TaxID=495550 RepID=A0A3N0Y2X7_ANAGA|nr:Replication protein A 32 kDa subunit [Anabarilius grahami]
MGGYTQSPGGFGSPAASQGGEKKGRTRAQQIVPCTVSQLMSAVQAEDVFKVGEVEIAQVTIVGVIRSTDKSTINIQYKVDDMTAAPMDVKQWIDTEDMGVDNSVIPPGSYVKVSGNLRSFQNNRSLVAFSVRVLEDMNEVTSHMLEVVNAHMQQSKPQNMSAMVMGVSTASCESSFSTLAIILTPFRRTMLHERKKNLVLLAHEKAITHELDMDEFVTEFSKMSRKLML